MGIVIEDAGLYYFTLSDFVGNTVDFTFIIDRTPASGTLTGVEDGSEKRYFSQ